MAQTLQNSFITTSKNEPSKPLKQNPFYSQLRNLRSPRSKLLHDYSKKERRIDRNGCRPTWIQGKGVQCTVGKKISFSKLYGNFRCPKLESGLKALLEVRIGVKTANFFVINQIWKKANFGTSWVIFARCLLAWGSLRLWILFLIADVLKGA